MIWTLVSIIPLISIFIFLNRRDDTVLAGAAGALLGVVVFLGGGSITAAIVPATYDAVPTSRAEIVSLDAATSVSGSFALGSGRLITGAVYFYYVRVGSASYKMESTPANNAVIVEDANLRDTGAILIYSPAFRSLIWSTRYPVKTEIHIPAGSVIREFSPNVGWR